MSDRKEEYDLEAYHNNQRIETKRMVAEKIKDTEQYTMYNRECKYSYVDPKEIQSSMEIDENLDCHIKFKAGTEKGKKISLPICYMQDIYILMQTHSVFSENTPKQFKFKKVEEIADVRFDK